jgi:hypothetical protein
VDFKKGGGALGSQDFRLGDFKTLMAEDGCLFLVGVAHGWMP